MERGVDDEELQIDDYDNLLSTYEFRSLVIFELYNAYFQPKRHEFDLQILNELVKEIISNRQALFIGSAALSGIVGSASYDILKALIRAIVSAFGDSRRRQEPFKEIENSAEKVVAFFDLNEQGTIQEISESTGIDAEKVLPILKLLGYKCKRRKKQKSIWCNKA